MRHIACEFSTRIYKQLCVDISIDFLHNYKLVAIDYVSKASMHVLT